MQLITICHHIMWCTFGIVFLKYWLLYYNKSVMRKRWKYLKHNVFQFLLAVDQLLNTLLFLFANTRNWADESLSSRSWRHYVKGDRKWPCILIDHIFFWQENHCKTAYESELLQKQLPPACRQDND